MRTGPHPWRSGLTAAPPCRHWQDAGYLIVYVTGRPDMQKHRVVAWLSQHNFPHGVVSFCDGLTHDPLRQKLMFLQSLVQEVWWLGRAPEPRDCPGRRPICSHPHGPGSQANRPHIPAGISRVLEAKAGPTVPARPGDGD